MSGRYYTVGRAIDPYTLKSYPVQKLRNGSRWATKTYLRIPSVGYAIVFLKPLDGQRIEVYQRNDKDGTFEMKEMIMRLDNEAVVNIGGCSGNHNPFPPKVAVKLVPPPPYVGSNAYNLWSGYTTPCSSAGQSL